MKQILVYVRETIKSTLTLQADNVNILKWWVDASYTTHHGMRGHTGDTMLMGKNGQRYIIIISKKKKLSIKSLIEAELIGANNVLPQLLWTRYFLGAQGHDIDENIMYQENMSGILLENNGRNSSTNKTKTPPSVLPHDNLNYCNEWHERKVLRDGGHDCWPLHKTATGRTFQEV